MRKDRLDTLLTEKGFFPSRERAKAAIMAGLILVNGEKIDKAGTKVDFEADIQIKGSGLKYVSRGGLKLEKAILCFHLDFTEKIIADIGASTGGFTDCALQNGASKVFAVDVGYGQLDWKLRQDPRVVVLERVNARYLTAGEITEAVDMITIDASFISLGKILPAVKEFLREDGCIVALIKPQFEAGREKVGKKGVVRDPAIHKEVIIQVLAVARDNALFCRGLTFSPITGPEGNIEYLALFQFLPPEHPIVSVENVVEEAFGILKKS
ncbi:TlyA family RNA methyltransferase [Candidatus Formimonas warabiya]|uniref:TlyA family rRNA (Cytidine-2'-O)-methyltransferase n=1 Tax=Formimonas warabiya TaxID=1761012 RepID=A0A3G1KNM0_FORW1|nr:TlyA family RNA methyltransferase [Candidatus Formimonas warabiya]ATW24058.1 TlyA family rRNA (cytidine-2'-O)-methyltransferase [Candidatus Formimonas warabiya]